MKLTYIFTIILMLAFFYFFSSCIKEDGPDNGSEIINHIDIGDRVPEFSVFDGAGNSFTNKDFENKKTYLIFFTTTCSDCQRELTRMKNIWSKIKAEPDCQIVAIARKQDMKTVDDFWKKEGYTFAKYIDPDRSVFDLFANSTVPRLYLIDKTGEVQWLLIENFEDISDEEFVEKIKSLP